MDDMNEELDMLKRDINSIKSAIRKNNPMLRELLAPADYKVMCLVYGLFSTVLGIAIQFLVWKYGSFEALPQAWRAAFWLSFAFIILGTGIYKLSIYRRRAREIGTPNSLWGILKLLNTGAFLHIYLSVLSLIIGFTIVFFASGTPWLSVAAWAIGVGLILAPLGVIAAIPEYLVMGYWYMVTGFAVSIVIGVAPYMLAGIEFGVGLLLFALFTTIHERGLKKRETGKVSGRTQGGRDGQ
jgi:hypothetical protein